MAKPKDHTDPVYQVVWSTQLDLVILQTPTLGFKKNLPYLVKRKSLECQAKNKFLTSLCDNLFIQDAFHVKKQQIAFLLI